MDIKLFSDLIDALGKVASGLQTLANLPKAERERYRQVLDDTYQLIHTTLNMIMLRLGDILLFSDESFLTEVESLDNYTEWMETERKFRLCQSLRIAVSETQELSQRLRGKISVREWDSLLEQMHLILRSEGELANYIGEKFVKLSRKAQDAQRGNQVAKDIRLEVENTRAALKREREKLMRQEIQLLDIV